MALPTSKDESYSGQTHSDGAVINSKLLVALEFQKILYEEHKKLPFYYSIKRVWEPCFAAFLLLLLGLPMLLIALTIRIRMGRPILYRQLRVGEFGQPFYAFKFRTMRNNSLKVVDMGYSPLAKVVEDPRVDGKLGAFLRKYKWDELPQLFNVLRGEMLLIGPRPYLYDENFFMSKAHLKKFAVKPGISGLWQCGLKEVRGTDKFDVDFAYVLRLSFGQDLKIFFKTLATVFYRGERL